MHQFQTSLDRSYFCPASPVLNLYNAEADPVVIVRLFNVQIQAFKVRNGKFGTRESLDTATMIWQFMGHSSTLWPSGIRLRSLGTLSLRSTGWRRSHHCLEHICLCFHHDSRWICRISNLVPEETWLQYHCLKSNWLPYRNVFQNIENVSIGSIRYQYLPYKTVSFRLVWIKRLSSPPSSRSTSLVNTDSAWLKAAPKHDAIQFERQSSQITWGQFERHLIHTEWTLALISRTPVWLKSSNHTVLTETSRSSL